MLAGRRILLGVTGGVAAFKAAYLARRLVEAGAEVRSIMTSSATEFLGPQSLAAITGTQPATRFFNADSVSPHTDLARWADAIVVAPATAASIARMAHGLSDDLLSATLLAATCPIVVAPAMHTEMWEHPATTRNIAQLRDDGCVIVGPGAGALAGGDIGIGRMVEPEDIVAAVEAVFGAGDMAGISVIVTAGGTREPIDPVRYLGNRSSGKMGHAIAVDAASRGASVHLVTSADASGVSGVVGVTVTQVETAEEMAAATWEAAKTADIAVMAAAVADFRPKATVDEKLRRADGPPELILEPTPDILAGVAGMQPRPFLVGFAAESGPADLAVPKARNKGVDLLVANNILQEGSGFGTDGNQVALINPDGTVEEWDHLAKSEVAHRLWDRVLAMRPGAAEGER